jgi:hypothetical protein
LLDGKEGVDGSSPSEGLKYLQIDVICCLPRREPEEDHGGGHVGADLQAVSAGTGIIGGIKGTLRERRVARVLPQHSKSGAPARLDGGSHTLTKCLPKAQRR